MPGAVADGQLIGAAADQATPTPSAIPTDTYSMNSGWKDSTGCPEALYTGFSTGLGVGSTTTKVPPSTSSGPKVLPSLTSQYVPSCAFTFTASNGLPGQGEMFIGMGPSYDTLFANAIAKAGFVKKENEDYTTVYLRGATAVGLMYVPPGTDGIPYSIVGVFGIN
jgi:hypothetical protein